MKGVILAGGTGSRLYPITKILNKHLLPVGKEPMILHGIRKLKDAGLDEILMIVGRSSIGLFAGLLGNGEEWGVKLTYRIQEDAGGIAQALGLAKGFVGNEEPVALLLGDNLFEDDLTPYIQKFLQHGCGARVLLKEVKDPHRYGVPTLRGERIIHIVEKPKHPSTNYSVTGFYMYDHQVFDMVDQLKPSARGELEITDINNLYAAKGELAFDILQGWWSDAGTFESLLDASSRLMEGGTS